MTVRTLAAADLTHLTHRVIRTHGDTRTVVAAFPDPVDALVWCDHLSTTPSTPEAPWDSYDVPGYDISPEALAPYLERSGKR